LVEVILNLKVTEKDLKKTRAELVQAKKDLKAAEADRDKQYQDMKNRIRYMYEHGETSFLTSVLESKNFADVINKADYYEDVYTTDRDLLEGYKKACKKVEEKIKDVEEKESALEETESDYKKQKETLNTTIKSKKSSLSNYRSELTKAKAAAEKYAAAVEAENRAAEEAARLERERKAAAEAAAAAAARQQASVRTQSVSSSSSSSQSSSSSGSSDSENIVSGGASGVEEDTENIVSGGASGETDYGSGRGSAVVSYAAQFVGNRYVWGGTSLTNGCDCSGYVMMVYKHFGVSLPHSSAAQRSCGRRVSISDIRPGDIVCYSGHVGIYAGGGNILNASNPSPYPRGGIKYTPYKYRTILAVRRIF